MDLTESFEKTITSGIVENWRYPRFFKAGISENADNIIIEGDDAKHISGVLRMKSGDLAVICDGDGMDFLCRISAVQSGTVEFAILEKRANEAEPDIYLRLFQCVPKSDKMEFIIQKATELGACEIIPVLSKRCVSRPDEKIAKKKNERYNRIAYEASKQCGRGRIPGVKEQITFTQAIKMLKPDELGIIFYECGGLPLKEIINAHGETKGAVVNVFIGSEGGFEEKEVQLANERGIISATLGKRILRCETAPISAISILMNLTNNM